MSRYVIGDVHGDYDTLVKLLYLIKVTKSDDVYFIGDLIDRGNKSADVVKLVRDINAKCVLGNHELMMIDSVVHNDSYIWLCNGGQVTLDSYNSDQQTIESDVEWMKRLPLLIDLDDYVLVHGGLEVDKPLDKQTDNVCWIREGFHNAPKYINRPVIIGHTITGTMNNINPGYLAVTDKWINIDTSCYWSKSGWLTALNLDDLTVYQVNAFTNVTRIQPIELLSNKYEHSYSR